MTIKPAAYRRLDFRDKAAPYMGIRHMSLAEHIRQTIASCGDGSLTTAEIVDRAFHGARAIVTDLSDEALRRTLTKTIYKTLWNQQPPLPVVEAEVRGRLRPN